MTSIVPSSGSPFDSIRHVDSDGNDYWSAREVAAMLGYASWQNFEGVIADAMTAARNSGTDPLAIFNEVVKDSPTSKRKYPIKDYHLTRHACYLLVQNGDPTKEIIAMAQAYFSTKTQEAERNTSIEAIIAAAKARVEARGRLSESYDELEGAASSQGMQGSRNFATLHNNGDIGMYGMSKDALAERHGLKPQRGQRRVNVNDHEGTLEMGATIMRNGIASADIDHMQDPTNQDMFSANREAGAEIRSVLMGHGIIPEDLPKEPHISEAQRLAQGQIPFEMMQPIQLATEDE